MERGRGQVLVGIEMIGGWRCCRLGVVVVLSCGAGCECLWFVVCGLWLEGFGREVKLSGGREYIQNAR